MMKTILLLAFAVLVSSSPVQHSHMAPHTYKTLLKELIDDLDKAVKTFSKDTEGNTPNLYLTELNGCKPKIFCQAEKELIKEVSGLSGAKFDQFRTDKKLMRNLNEYNQHHGKTCDSAAKDPVHVQPHAFFKNLLTCVRSEFSHLK